VQFRIADSLLRPGCDAAISTLGGVTDDVRVDYKAGARSITFSFYHPPHEFIQ
jgi:hypothetical protein